MKAGEEREGGGSDQWGHMWPMVGRDGGLDIYLGEAEALNFSTGEAWRPPFSPCPWKSRLPPSFLCDMSSKCEDSLELYSEEGVP